MLRKVVGVGVNDCPDPVFMLVNGIRTPDRRYVAWASMLQRSYSAPSKGRQPSYATSEVCDRWLSRTTFNAWMDAQEWEGLDLDKNILKEGNNVYCPEYCVFVPEYLNNLLVTRHNFRGDQPLGVYKQPKRKHRAYRAKVSKGGEVKYLGDFLTPGQAHAAWQKGKIEAIEIAMSRYANEKCCRQDVLDALSRRISVLQEDLANGRETYVLK